MALLEGACSFGMIISPIIGSLLYEIGGYNLPFFVFASLFALAAVTLNVLISESVDGEMRSEKHTAQSLDSSVTTEESSSTSCALSLKLLFVNLNCLFALLTGFWTYFCWCQLEPVLALRLTEFHFNSL